MPEYERLTRIDAPLETVWAFHDRPDGLEILTPASVGLRFESAVGPDGATIDDEIRPGADLVYSIDPFGIGYRREVEATIVDRWQSDDRAGFTDVLQDVPGVSWRHTHELIADGDATILRDHVEYGLEIDWIERLSEPLVTVGLGIAFRDRHRRTKARLEGADHGG